MCFVQIFLEGLVFFRITEKNPNLVKPADAHSKVTESNCGVAMSS